MPKKNVLCLPREGKGVYGPEWCKGARDIVENVDHAGANAEEGSEGEDREVLGNEDKFFQEGLARQQVLWSSHKVVLRADLPTYECNFCKFIFVRTFPITTRELSAVPKRKTPPLSQMWKRSRSCREDS